MRRTSDGRDGGLPHDALIAVRAAGDMPPVATDEERRSLCASLRDALYGGVFSAREPRPEWRSLASELSAANRSRSFWRDGWRVERVERGFIVATDGVHRRVARANEYALTFATDLPPRAGMAATLFFPRESLVLQQDVYYAFGETIPVDEDDARALRLYLNVRDDALPRLYERVTGELNRLAVPFTLKTMLLPLERGRRDATLLYVSPRHAGIAQAVVPRPLLQAGVPLFALEVAPGIGMGESPETGESFGMNRCRLVAEGIVDAWMEGRSDIEARLAAVERRFRAGGIDWEQPHRNHPRITLTADNVATWLGLDPSRYRMTDCSRRNRNFAVAGEDGSGYFVKQLRVRGLESLRMMEREADVVPKTGALAPRLIRFDRDAEALVFALMRRDEAQPLDLAVAGARTLRRLHALPFEGDGEPPGILTAHRGGPLGQWLGAGQRALIEQMTLRQGVADALDRMASDWRSTSLIHGDVKWDNCLWDAAAASLTWVDWELAGGGDPPWDAGCFAQAYLSHFVISGDDDLRPALTAFLDAYGGDDGRIIRYAAARMLQTALEVMHGQPRPTPLALALLERCAELLTAGDHL